MHMISTINHDRSATSATRPKAYSYLRFSTPEQMKGDSHNRQTRLAQEYAARHGLDLDTSLTFDDLGVSAFRGKNMEDGGLGLFKRAVEDGIVQPGSILLVESLDRISRQSPRKASNTLSSICDLGVTVVTLSDGHTYTSQSLDEEPLSFMLAMMVFMRANEESRMKAQRLAAAWESKRQSTANGKLPVYTSVCPKWLRMRTDQSGFELIPDRSEIVRTIFKMTLDGQGQHAIAEHLNKTGVKPFGRGKMWHSTYVDKILMNRAVIGTLQTHKTHVIDGQRKKELREAIPDYFPAVIDQETFDRVQQLKATRNPRRGRHASVPLQNIFGKLGVCPDCGGTVTRITKNQAKGWVYLACQRAKAGAGCTYKASHYSAVETAFLSNASWLLSFPPSSRTDLDEEENATTANLDAVEVELRRLLKLVAGGDISSDMPTVRTMIADLEKNKADLTARLHELLMLKEEASGPSVAKRVERLSEALSQEAPDRARINALLRETFSQVVINHHTMRLEFHWKQGGVSEILYGWPSDR